MGMARPLSRFALPEARGGIASTRRSPPQAGRRSADGRSLVIECTGFPGAGKTTVCRGLELRLRVAGFRVGTSLLEPFLRRGRGDRPGPWRTRLAVLSRVLRRHPRVVLAILSVLPLLRAEGRPAAWRERLTLLRYYLLDVYILSVVRVDSGSLDYCLRSEGIVHHAACLALHARPAVMPRAFERLIRHAPLPDVLIQVRVPESTARDRMLARGIPGDWQRSDPEWVEATYRRWTHLLPDLAGTMARYRVRHIAVDNASEEARAAGLALALAQVAGADAAARPAPGGGA